MTKLLGYAFLGIGIMMLVTGGSHLLGYIKAPEQFPIYHYLTNLPLEERTIQTKAGDMLLPIGIFKISGLLSIVLAGFLLVAMVRMLISAGVQMIRSDTRDMAKQLIKEIRKLSNQDLE